MSGTLCSACGGPRWGCEECEPRSNSERWKVQQEQLADAARRSAEVEKVVEGAVDRLLPNAPTQQEETP